MKLLKRQANNAILLAILAAVLYGISTPVSKVLLRKLPPTLMAALLYLGAGIGMFFVVSVQRLEHKDKSENLTRNDCPFVIGMVLLDILAPILLMISLTMTSAESVSLLNNFEIVATTLIAYLIFKEKISRKLWIAIIFVSIASVVLSISDIESFSFSLGSLLALSATICWGLENNFTRMLSVKNPLHIVVIKGIGSGLGSLIIAYFIKELSFDLIYIIFALVLGFFAYGLSIYFYISAQRYLGAAKTSAFYAIAPFVGVIVSWMFFHETLTIAFYSAVILMIIGTVYAVLDSH